MNSPPPGAPGAVKGAPALLVLILGSLIAFAPLSIDMYLPALPQIAREFGSSAGEVQYTLASYFLGMAAGLIFCGPLADRLGRKPVLYVGFTLYALASVGCALTEGTAAMIALRALQALGGCAGMIVPMAVVRDLFDYRTSARVLSRLNLVMGAAPILAPLAGSALLAVSGWRSIFWLLGAASVAIVAAAHFALAETLPPEKRRRDGVGAILRNYAGLLGHRRYMGYVLARTFGAVGLFTNIAGSPFVLIDMYGLSPAAAAWILGANGLGFVIASQINHRLLATRTPDKVLSVALILIALDGIVLAVAGYTGAFGVWGIAVPACAFITLLGLIHPNASAGAMAGQPADKAGSAAALLGVTQFSIAGAAGGLVGLFNDGSARPMVTIIAAGSVLSWLCYTVMVRGFGGDANNASTGHAVEGRQPGAALAPEKTPR